MMYLKQFPDICREMGLAMKENSKIVTLSVPDICYSIAINKKLFLEDLELVVDSFDDVHEAIAIFEADVNAGKFNDMGVDDFQRLQSIFDKAKETGRLKDDTGLFQAEVGLYAQHAECLKTVLEKLLEKLRKEVEKARLYSSSRYNFPIVMKQIDASCYKAYVPTKSNNGFIVQEYIFDLDDIGKMLSRKSVLSSMNFSRRRTLLTATVFWRSLPSRLDTLTRPAEFFSKVWATLCRTSKQKPVLT